MNFTSLYRWSILEEFLFQFHTQKCLCVSSFFMMPCSINNKSGSVIQVSITIKIPFQFWNWNVKMAWHSFPAQASGQPRFAWRLLLINFNLMTERALFYGFAIQTNCRANTWTTSIKTWACRPSAIWRRISKKLSFCIFTGKSSSNSSALLIHVIL